MDKQERKIRRRIAAKKRQERRKKHDLTGWIIEFSKKVVVICALLYIIIEMFSILVIWQFMDTSALSTLIMESSDVLKVCVFGYMIKAGLENWQKIRNARIEKELMKNEETSEEKGEAVG